MTKTELEIERNPESDRLFRCRPDAGEDVLIRVRVLEVPGRSPFVNKVDRDVITVQTQSSIAADETGDVATDSDGAHLIMSASRHTIHLDGVAARGGDAAALLEQLVQDEVDRAYRKALARRLVFAPLAKLQEGDATQEAVPPA